MGDVRIEGRNAVLGALRLGSEIREIYVDSRANIDRRMGEMLSIASQRGIAVKRVERRVLDDISSTGVHMGVIAFARAPSLVTTTKQLLTSCRSKGESPFLVVIDDVVYEQNLGAIARTANAAGVQGIIIPRSRKGAVTPEVIRISTGAALFTPIIEENLYSALKAMKSEGVHIVVADMDGKDLYSDANLKGSIAFVLGGEHKGVSEPMKRRCDEVVRIPMYGMVSSLNLSAACSILLYEKLRQDRS